MALTLEQLNSAAPEEALAMLDGVQMYVGQFGVLVGEQRQFEVVRGEQRQRTILLEQMAADGKSQRHPVER